MEPTHIDIRDSDTIAIRPGLAVVIGSFASDLQLSVLFGPTNLSKAEALQAANEIRDNGYSEKVPNLRLLPDERAQITQKLMAFAEE